MDDYACAVARIRTLEAKLFDESIFENLLEMSESGIASFLQGAGYGGFKGESSGDVEQILNGETGNVLELVYRLTPEPDRHLISMFRMEYDFHNFGVLLKHKLLNKEVKADELSRLGTVDTELMKSAFMDYMNVGVLEEPYRSLLEELQGVDIEKSMILIEKRKWQYFIGLSKNSSFMTGLVRSMIDLTNLKNFIGAKFFEISEEEFTPQIIPDGKLNADTFREYYTAPLENFFRYILFTDYYQSSGQFQSVLHDGKDGLWLIAGICDNYLLKFLSDRSRFVFFAIEPLVNYIFLKKQETKILRNIWIGKRNGFPKEEIKKHLGMTGQ
jgi:vacuolar-type H+-ATPase subunit C/Vma6